jgi:pimeloyl-ACP methyl ester carboxylesterase
MKVRSSAFLLCILSAVAVDGFVISRRTQVSSIHSPLYQSTIDTAAASNILPNILADFSYETSSRLPYSPNGYSSWSWDTHHAPSTGANGDQKRTTHKINYLTLGPEDAPAIVLVHGFGASSYHWRHNIPILARTHKVYALDLLGFGWSDKPIMDYDASVWKDQVVDFVEQIVFNSSDDDKTKQESVVLAGNSLGGYTAMFASSDDRIKDYVKGCVLLNSAGRFRDPDEQPKPDPNPIIQSISAAIQRMVIAASFIYTKQPSRIEQILRQVYPANDANVDAELVESIQTPSLDPNAAEVFYRVIAKNGSGPQAYVDDILQRLECPVLLCWGEQDPWIKSAAADRMERVHAQFHGSGGEERWMKRVSIEAGHCPHDENPEDVNRAILEFLAEVF